MHAQKHGMPGPELVRCFGELWANFACFPGSRLHLPPLQVRLRRTIGLKKDDYYLDKKHIT